MLPLVDEVDQPLQSTSSAPLQHKTATASLAQLDYTLINWPYHALVPQMLEDSQLSLALFLQFEAGGVGELESDLF